MNLLDRRSFIKSAPIAALAASTATATQAFPAPDAPTALELPQWWEKLTGPTAENDPEVFLPWQDTEATRELAVKLEELHNLLVRIAAPAGVETIQNIALQWFDGIPQNVNVIGRSGQWGEGIHMFRPEFGWVDKTPGRGGLV